MDTKISDDLKQISKNLKSLIINKEELSEYNLNLVGRLNNLSKEAKEQEDLAQFNIEVKKTIKN